MFFLHLQRPLLAVLQKIIKTAFHVPEKYCQRYLKYSLLNGYQVTKTPAIRYKI